MSPFDRPPEWKQLPNFHASQDERLLESQIGPFCEIRKLWQRFGALCHALTHEVEERELASRYAVLIHESRRKIAAKNSTQIIVGYLNAC